MGLTIGVGWLARAHREEEAEDFEHFREPYELLNEVLLSAGLPAHYEPLDLPDSIVLESQMWRYGGLHAIRRLAAYHACENQLPPPGKYEDYASDPMIERLNEVLLANVGTRRGWLSLLFKKSSSPKFEHLMLHSDCEGFYVPQDFEKVIFDDADPQRTGLGAMVGSTQRLLAECMELAALIDLPLNLDPEDECLWENAESPREDGKKWEIYGLEAFGISRLIHACNVSIANEAALVFG